MLMPIADLDPTATAVTFAGDTHGDADWCSTVTKMAARAGATWVVECGDFGWWPRMQTRSGRPSTDHLSRRIERACVKYGVTGWVFIDGNHDDHDALAEIVAAHGTDGPVEVAERIFYAPRGSTFALGGVTFGALGGAISIDAHLEATGAVVFNGPAYRPGWDWFPDTEAPTAADAARLADNAGPDGLDVVVTHDCPAGIDLGRKGTWVLDGPVADLVATTRQVLTDAVTATRPATVVHGHWHRRHSATLELPAGPVAVEGVASNALGQGRNSTAWLTRPLADLAR